MYAEHHESHAASAFSLLSKPYPSTRSLPMCWTRQPSSATGNSGTSSGHTNTPSSFGEKLAPAASVLMVSSTLA